MSTRPEAENAARRLKEIEAERRETLNQNTIAESELRNMWQSATGAGLGAAQTCIEHLIESLSPGDEISDEDIREIPFNAAYADFVNAAFEAALEVMKKEGKIGGLTDSEIRQHVSALDKDEAEFRRQLEWHPEGKSAFWPPSRIALNPDGTAYDAWSPSRISMRGLYLAAWLSVFNNTPSEE